MFANISVKKINKSFVKRIHKTTTTKILEHTKNTTKRKKKKDKTKTKPM